MECVLAALFCGDGRLRDESEATNYILDQRVDSSLKSYMEHNLSCSVSTFTKEMMTGSCWFVANYFITTIKLTQIVIVCMMSGPMRLLVSGVMLLSAWSREVAALLEMGVNNTHAIGFTRCLF